MDARPFLKWAGGKGQLLPELLERVDRAGGFKRYHEPFLGGGALFFALMRENKLGRGKAYLSENNPRLVDTYRGLRDHPDEVIALLQRHREKNCEAYYYAVRAEVPADIAEQAARIIYLNKTCFNGLFRENSRGGFNVPFGKYKNPGICAEANLRACAAALRKARIDARGFETVLDYAKRGDFVYFDPPYHPVSKTASFTSYHKGGFGEDEQRELAGVFDELTKRKVNVLLSNSDTPFVVDLYRHIGVLEYVQATRAVNSRADRRGKVSEVLVSNF
jgi:DNA adenine methylase